MPPQDHDHGHDHDHAHHLHQHHHHAPGEGHPPASVAPSILRMAAFQRLAVAAAAIALIWGAAIWAMS